MSVFDREHYFRDLLAKQVGGRTEVTLPFGRADVMTDTIVWEVEPASRYPAGVRQALQYASQTGLVAALATYGPGDLVTGIFEHLTRIPAPGVELWWLYERRFVPVRTVGKAAAIAARVTGDLCMSPPPLLTCEVIGQNATTGETRSCDGRPVIYQPVRMCQEHLDQVLRPGPPIPPPPIPADGEDGPDLSRRDAAGYDLKLASDMTYTLERRALPHLEPGDRALLSAYLIETRSILWHGAIDLPGGPELFGDDPEENLEIAV